MPVSARQGQCGRLVYNVYSSALQYIQAGLFIGHFVPANSNLITRDRGRGVLITCVGLQKHVVWSLNYI